jgi:hypothetical protein
MDKAIIAYTEPSIGQVEYLKYLRVMSAVQKPSFMLVEQVLPEVDDTTVKKAIAFLIERHESLRTVFPMIDHEIRQIVLPATDKRFQLEYVDVHGDDHDFLNIRKEYFDKAASVFADIEEGPLIKLFMFRRDKGYHFFLLLHHIICDEWSCVLIGQELIMIYQSFLAGNEPPLPPLTVQLKDYCEQQNKWLYQNKEALSTFWKHKLQDFDTVFDITGFRKMYAGRKNKAIPDNSEYSNTELSAILDRPDASSYTSIISGMLFQGVKNLASGKKCGLSSVIYASFFLFLYAYTGKKKILVPALMADRYQPDYQQLIGCLLGSIYLPVAINKHTTIGDFITEINEEIIGVIVNRRLIFSHNFLQLDGGRVRNCCDMYVNYFRKEQGFSIEQYIAEKHLDLGEAIHYPVYAMITEHNDAVAFKWKYNKYLFNKEIIEDMVTCYKEVLQYMVINTGKTIQELASCCHVDAFTL